MMDFDSKASDDSVRLKPYNVLSHDDIVEQQTNLIRKTSELLGVTFSDARVLLKVMKWDSDKLYLEYTDNTDAVCKKAGIDPTKNQTVTGKKGTGECLICMEYSDDITNLSCGHGYCADCWKDYLAIEVKEKNQKFFALD